MTATRVTGVGGHFYMDFYTRAVFQSVVSFQGPNSMASLALFISGMWPYPCTSPGAMLLALNVPFGSLRPALRQRLAKARGIGVALAAAFGTRTAFPRF